MVEDDRNGKFTKILLWKPKNSNKHHLSTDYSLDWFSFSTTSYGDDSSFFSEQKQYQILFLHSIWSIIVSLQKFNIEFLNNYLQFYGIGNKTILFNNQKYYWSPNVVLDIVKDVENESNDKERIFYMDCWVYSIYWMIFAVN